MFAALLDMLGLALLLVGVGVLITAVQYQLWHAVALIALSAVTLPRIGLPAALLIAGTVLFSGSLYALALTGARWLGPVTPIGGDLMIAGWAVLAWRAIR